MTHLNYHHLYYFWTVCHEGGFTKAANKLRLSQSAISEQVSSLESSFDQKLIARTTRRFELTEAGQIALKYADSIFSTGNELIDLMAHRPVSRKQAVRIGALGSLSRNLQATFLEPILDRDDVHFSITVGDFKRLIRLLQEHSLDIVLSTFPAGEEGSPGLYTHLLCQSPLCVVSVPGRKKTRVTSAKELLEEHRVFLPSASLEARADFDHFVETNHVRLRVGGEIDDIALLRTLAFSDKGVVVIPKLGAEKDLEVGNLILLYEFKAIRQKFYAITRQKKFPNPLIASLVRSLR